MIDPIIEAEKIRSRTNLLIAIIPLIFAYILHPTINMIISDNYDNKIILKLYSDIYFSRIKDDILLVPIKNIQIELEQEILKGTFQYKNEEYFLNKLLSPYEVLRQVLTKYKIENQFKNIPNHYVQKMNNFLDERIAKDKHFLNRIESVEHIKNFSSSLEEITTQAEKEFKEIYRLPDNLKPGVLKKIQKKLLIEASGLALVNRNILIDYLTTYEYISRCKEDFDKTIDK